MPRLSVDIDLTYVPVALRLESFAAIDAAMKRISGRVLKAVPNTKVIEARLEGAITRLTVRQGGVQTKIEVTCPAWLRVCATNAYGVGFGRVRLRLQSRSNLQIDLLGTSTQVTIDNWFAGGNQAMQKITAASLKIDSQPFFMGRLNDAKGLVWEEVRKQSYIAMPPRLKAFYCFESRELAERADREWFADREPEAREYLELRIAAAATVHRCDSQWLETPEDQWRAAAEQYWKGEMTASPFPEMLVHGAVYFPGWEQFPLKW